MAFLNEYEKLHIVGKGSYATIWKVRHLKLGYVRAIKVSNEMVDDENDHAYQSFLNECKVLLKIGNGAHPNIVHIYQPRLIENRAIVEMDYIDGETFNEYLAHKQFLPMDEVARFTDDVVRALAYCHHDIYKYLMDPNVDNLRSDPDNGRRYIIDEETKQRLVEKYSVVHNDLHSNNIMRRNYDGGYVLLDFGLAIQNGRAVKSSSRRGGALEYMSPEKFDDSSTISTQSDVYSLGVMLYEALAGRVPFPLDQKAYESNPTAAGYDIMRAHKEAVAPSIELLRREAFEKTHPGQTYTKDFPDWLETVIRRCLEKNPAQRYANAKELYNDIKKLRAENPDSDKAELHRLAQENSGLASQIDALAAENKRLSADVQNARQQLEQQKVASEMEQQNNNLRTANQQLDSELEAVRQNLDMAQNEISRLKADNEELKNRPPQEKIVEKVVEKPVEKVVEKIVEKPVEKVVYKGRKRAGWIVAAILFFLTTIAAVAVMGYFINLYQDLDWQLQQAPNSEELDSLRQKVSYLESQNGLANDNSDEINRLNQQIADLQQTVNEKDATIANLKRNSGNSSSYAPSREYMDKLNEKLQRLQSEINAKDAQILRLTNALNNQ